MATAAKILGLLSLVGGALLALMGFIEMNRGSSFALYRRVQRRSL
ncbi:hypothetical protein [Brucella intermedia]|nr:hypothetical protein [Brucella intermedia]